MNKVQGFSQNAAEKRRCTFIVKRTPMDNISKRGGKSNSKMGGEGMQKEPLLALYRTGGVASGHDLESIRFVRPGGVR